MAQLHPIKKVATPLSEGNESAIHSHCSGGAWGSAPLAAEIARAIY